MADGDRVGKLHLYVLDRDGVSISQPEGFIPLTVDDLIEKAVQAGLAGLSLTWAAGLTRRTRRSCDGSAAWRSLRGLWLGAATGGTDVERLTVILRAAAELGCSTLRTVVGGAKLGGDRREMNGRWNAFIEQTRRRPE